MVIAVEFGVWAAAIADTIVNDSARRARSAKNRPVLNMVGIWATFHFAVRSVVTATLDLHLLLASLFKRARLDGVTNKVVVAKLLPYYPSTFFDFPGFASAISVAKESCIENQDVAE